MSLYTSAYDLADEKAPAAIPAFSHSQSQIALPPPRNSQPTAYGAFNDVEQQLPPLPHAESSSNVLPYAEDEHNPVMAIALQYSGVEGRMSSTTDSVEAMFENQLGDITVPGLRFLVRQLCKDSSNEMRQHIRAFINHQTEINAQNNGSPAKSPRNWNEEFQSILGSFDDVAVLIEEAKFVRLSTLASDFVNIAKTIGRTIIMEKHWPVSRKTIKPVDLGIAGGAKYISQGVFFKFAVDNHGLYGSDEHASKVAGQELLALSKIFSCNEDKIFLPLMCLIDYRGYRLVAVSILPIKNESTLIYGSADGGKSILTKDPVFNDKMASIAKKLNLAAHEVLDSKGERRTIHGPFDMEGHKGFDDRYYVLDFARLFPSEPPSYGTASKNSYLYRLLRPELVRSSPHPVSSDVFVPGLMATRKPEELAAVEALHHRLIKEVVPKFARWLEDKEVGGEEHRQLSTHMHHFGINVRYLGLVRKHTTSAGWRLALLTEIVARTLKNLQRTRFRQLMKDLEYNNQIWAHPNIFRDEALGFINLVFGEHQDSRAYWRDTILPEIVNHRFLHALTEDELTDSKNTSRGLKALFNGPRVLAPLLLRFCEINGLLLNQEMLTVLNNEADTLQIQRLFRGRLPISEEYFIGVTEIVKQMPVVSYAEGTAYLIKSLRHMRASLRDMAQFVGKKSQEKFEENLRYSLDDCLTLSNYSMLLQEVFLNHEAGHRLLLRSVEMNPHHARSWYYLATLNNGILKNPDEAERCYLKAIEVSGGKHPNSCKDYANYLRFRKKDLAGAEKYYRLALSHYPNHQKSLQNLSIMILNESSKIKFCDEAFDLLRRASLLPDQDIQVGTSPKNIFASLLRLRAEMLFTQKPEVAIPEDSKGVALSGSARNLPAYLVESDACFRLAVANSQHTSYFLAYGDFLCRHMSPPDLERAELMYLKAIDYASRDSDSDSRNRRVIEHQMAIRAYAKFLESIAADTQRVGNVYQAATLLYPRDAFVLVDYANFLCSTKTDLAESQKLFERAFAASPGNKYVVDQYIEALKTMQSPEGKKSFLRQLTGIGKSDKGEEKDEDAERRANRLRDMKEVSKNLKPLNPPYPRAACDKKGCRGNKGLSGLLCCCMNLKAISLATNYPFARSVFADPELVATLRQQMAEPTVIPPFPPPHQQAAPSAPTPGAAPANPPSLVADNSVYGDLPAQNPSFSANNSVYGDLPQGPGPSLSASNSVYGSIQSLASPNNSSSRPAAIPEQPASGNNLYDSC